MILPSILAFILLTFIGKLNQVNLVVQPKQTMFFWMVMKILNSRYQKILMEKVIVKMVGIAHLSISQNMRIIPGVMVLGGMSLAIL